MTAPESELTELAQFELDPAAKELLPVELCLARRVIILGKVPARPEDPLTLGMVAPDDQALLAEVRERLGRPIVPVQLNDYEVRRALAGLHGVAARDVGVADLVLDARRRVRFQPGLPASALLDDLLSVAVQRGATDVHIEVYADDVDLRLRVDGHLRQLTTPLSPDNAQRVVARLKVLCELDPLARRTAQDGRFAALYTPEEGAPRRVDFRLSVVPGTYGEDAVIRVLDPTRFRLDLATLGFEPRILERWRRLALYPDGLLLVAGPTMSGKTNTLYATADTLRAGGTKVVTVEDPIEHELSKVNQKSVGREMGFPDYVRAFLRQNPDVILVGEVRDAATAETVVQAATTGHLVLSSIHTRDGVHAIARMRALGTPDDYLAAILVGVLGQRLVARICEGCRAEERPDPALVEAYCGAAPAHGFFAGAGCAACHGTGFRGLLGVIELLEGTSELAQAIGRGAGMQELSAVAARTQLTTLHEQALARVARGETSLGEVARVLPPPTR